jgi:hypothetical protein
MRRQAQDDPVDDRPARWDPALLCVRVAALRDRGPAATNARLRHGDSPREQISPHHHGKSGRPAYAGDPRRCRLGYSAALSC